MLKKLGIVVGCLLGALLLAILVLPLVVDVDKFRPQIVKAVNENINGEFRLGKLNLSLWGGLRVKAESIYIKGAKDERALLETDSAFIEIPFLSLLAFKPTLTAVVVKPKIDVVKHSNGKFNVEELMKTTPGQKNAQLKPIPPMETAETSEEVAAAPAVETGKAKMTDTKAAKDVAKSEATGTGRSPSQAKAADPAAVETPKIPAIVANAALGIRIDQAIVNYQDQAANQKITIDGLFVDVQNLGLRQTIRAKIELPLKAKVMDNDVDGVVRAEANVTPIMVDGEVRSASGNIFLDATKLAVTAAKGMATKTAKMPLTMKMDFDGTENDLRIKDMNLVAHELVINAKGLVTMKPEPQVKLELRSNPMPLGSLEALVPMLKEYALGGNLVLNLNVDGPVAKIAAKGDLEVKGGKAAYPAMLKAPVNFDLRTTFTENSLNLQGLNVTAPGSDLVLKGTVQNFMAPQFNFALNGKQLDLDQFVKWEALSAPKKTAWLQIPEMIATAEAKASPPAKAKATAAPRATDADAKPAPGTNPMLAMAKNPMIMGAAGTFTANLGKFQAYGTPITDIALKATLRNMVLNVESATLKTFEGVLNAKATADLKAPGLNYSSTGTVKGLSSKAALAHYVPKFKDTLEGKMNANWNLSGAAYPEAIRMRSIAGTVNVNAEKGRLRSVNMKDSIQQIMSKVPFLAGKQPPNIDEGFESMRADMKFAGGVIDVNPMELIGGAKGLTIKGKSKIQEDMQQETFIDVFDPNRLLPAEISDGKDAALALRVTGPISSPQTDYGYTVSRLAKNAVKNEVQKRLGGGLQNILGGAAGGGGQSGGSQPAAKPADAVKDAIKKIKLF